ncbi:MAG: endo-1,4-beta-xylanase [Gemmatimonadota bacterium]
MSTPAIRRHVFVALSCVAAGCSQGTPATVIVPVNPGLKDAYKDAFLIGTALNPRQFGGTDTMGIRLIDKHFNAATPENVMKPQPIHPQPGQYNWAPADAYVAFNEAHGITTIGHTLVWHSQTPAWFFTDSAGKPKTREAMLALMKDHIYTVVGRYKGRVKGWDVVNEALNEDGTMRQSPWFRTVGADFVIKAFQYAHEADPAAQLFYNDYNLATPAKRDGAVRLAKSIRDAGIPVAGINTQEHHKIDSPSITLIDSTFIAIRNAGFHANVTELDVDVLPRGAGPNTADVAARAQAVANGNPYTAGLPDSMQTKLAKRYEDLFRVYLKHADIIDRVTFWGTDDGSSWLNGFPVPGRTNHALLFDRKGNTKPAYDAVMALALKSSRSR